MDDMLIVSYMSKSRTAALISLLRQIFLAFGITLNTKKSVFEPVSVIDFLGYTISVEGVIKLTQKRYNKLISQTHHVLTTAAKHKRFVPFTTLSKYLGVLVSTFEAVVLARVYAFPLY